MTIVLSPYSRGCGEEGKSPSPKNYPYWNFVVKQLKEKGFTIIQIGTSQEQEIEGVDSFNNTCTLEQVEQIVNDADTWLSVDNFLQHMIGDSGKRGVVVYSITDPEIFGYKQNINLLKDRKFIRKGFSKFNSRELQVKALVTPKEVVDSVLHILSK